MALNPEILGRPLFPSAQRTKELLGGFGQYAINAITPTAGTPPATMAGVSIPPAGASLGQLQFAGPLINTSRFNQQAAPQPTQPAQSPFNYGAYAATVGLPTFDVTKTQTPFSQYSASAPQQLTSGLAQPAPSFPTQLPTRPSVPEAITPNQSTPAAKFARISDWSQNPLVQAARATGDIAAIERATVQARNQGRGVFQPNDVSGVSLAALRTSNPEAGFGSMRTPEQQQALLAQMRTQGSRMAGSQETFFAEKRQEREALRGAEALARAQGVRSMDIMRAREAATTPSTIAGIRAATSPYQAGPRPSFAMTAQSEFTRNLPVGGSAPRPATSLGLSGLALYEQQQAARRAAGITGPYSNTRAQQRQSTREMARSMGIDPALSRGAQEEQEQYFRSRGLM